MTAQPDQLTLEMKHVLPASRQKVFTAFTDPNELARWWGPEGFSTPSLDFAPRVGGRYWLEMQPPEGEPFHLTGQFRQVAPPSQLSYTFVWEPPDPDDIDTIVRLSFRDLGGSTEVALSQGPFKTVARHSLHRDGWTESFDKLERLLRSPG